MDSQSAHMWAALASLPAEFNNPSLHQVAAKYEESAPPSAAELLACAGAAFSAADLVAAVRRRGHVVGHVTSRPPSQSHHFTSRPPPLSHITSSSE